METLDPRLEPISDEEYKAKVDAVAAFLKSPDAMSKWGWDINQERLDQLIDTIYDRERMCQTGESDIKPEIGFRTHRCGLVDNAETLIFELKALAMGDPTLEATAVDNLRWTEYLQGVIDAYDEEDEEAIDRLPQYEQDMLAYEVKPAVVNAFKSIFADRIELIEDPEIAKTINLNFRTMDENERDYYWSFADREEEARLWEYNSEFMRDEKFYDEAIRKIQDDNRPITNRNALLFTIREQAENIVEPTVEEIDKQY